MARSEKTLNPRVPLEDDAQTRVMSRSLLPPASTRRPIANDERTVVDFPRAGEDERTMVAPLVFPKAASSLSPIPKSKFPTGAPWQERTSYFHPAPRPSSVVPPPPPSAPNLHTSLPLPPPPPPPAVPLEATPSSPGLVRDVALTPPPPPPLRLRIGREPMLYIAAGLGVLGTIFAFGIVVGLVVSLRSRAPESSAAASSAPVAAAPVASPVVDAPRVVEPVALAPVPVNPPKAEPPKAESPKRFTAAQPAPAPHVARASLAAAVPKPEPAPKRVHIGAPSDPDFDAASAANALARAQLEASLR